MNNISSTYTSRGNLGAFGDQLRAAREATGLTQEQLAEAVGVSQEAVSQWENGGSYPRTQNVAPIARATGASLEALLLAIEKDQLGIPPTPMKVVSDKRRKRRGGD